MNLTTATLTALRSNRILHAELTVYERDYFDGPEQARTVRVYATGRVTVNGLDVKTDAARDAWISMCADHTRATGQKATLTPEPALGVGRAHALHLVLARLGVKDHATFAAYVLGRPVPHFRDLTEADATRVWHVAKSTATVTAA